MATVPAADALVRADQATLWHPASHFDDAALLPPIPIRAARGPWLERADGGRILDAIASWWTSVHGHCEPTVIEAIATQARTLDHVMFAGFTHAPAVTLARGLLDAAGPGFGRVFYADSGSDAIEIAAKLSVQYHQQRGDGRRTRFAALEHGYHGETLGALALCGSPVYRAPFSPLLREVLFLPTPELRGHQHDALHGDAGADDPACERALALLERDADTLAAIVIEPLVQCAGQMRMTGVGFHRRIVERARALGIHVIADEIAVGFGRTGRMFASDWSGATADFLCLGKGLSGGALPLSAVLIGADIESAFRGAPERAFAHSHTFCGNPIATAAAEASLSLLRARLGPAVDATIAALAQAQRTVAQSCPAVVASRQCGAIVAFTLAPHRRRPDDGRIGLALRRAALARGVLLRPLGDTLYWMPPLCLEPDAIATLTAVTCAAIDEVLG
ncbi:MAG: adenosylmethionine--8-amino-7-oxononanoate transaminase [Nannocystaceae bacterium]|nr:adenosylmethionine--8-amino-7-oxononanoate transaminase [Nannocystaceae bacterium]